MLSYVAGSIEATGHERWGIHNRKASEFVIAVPVIRAFQLTFEPLSKCMSLRSRFCFEELLHSLVPVHIVLIVVLTQPFYFSIQQIPHSLFKEGGYEHREALFGVPPYGGSIAQNVYYADSDLCNSNVDTRKGYPTRPNDIDGNMEAWKSPYILMLDRGGCTFVNKVCHGRV